MTLDTPPDLCQSDAITAPVPFSGTDAPCHRIGGEMAKTSSFGHGGPRPGFGGPQPGSGRPRKTTAPPAPLYTLDTPRWCVYAVWGQAEIPSAAELTRIGYENYLPLVAIRRRDPVIKSMWHTVRVPFIPGYGFIRITQVESLEPITAIRGIRDVLRRPDGRAAAMPDSQIAKMLLGEDGRLKLPVEHGDELKPGTAVSVREGPFEGHAGTVIECDGVKTRVGIEIFGRVTPVWLDRVGVEVE